MKIKIQPRGPLGSMPTSQEQIEIEVELETPTVWHGRETGQGASKTALIRDYPKWVWEKAEEERG